MKRLFLACLLIFSAITGLSAQPDTFYVDTTGVDAAGRGTFASPARTIRYTIDSLINDTLADPCVIRIRPGSFLETAPFTVDSIGTDSVNTLTLEASDPSDPPEIRTDDTTQSQMIRVNVPYTTMDHLRFATAHVIDGGGWRGTMAIFQPHVTVSNCMFYRNPAISNRTTFRRGISFGQNDVNIRNCLFYGSTNQSIVLELSGAFEGIEITNNTFIERPSYRPSGIWNGSQVGIAFWSGAGGSTLRRSKVWNNIFYGLPAGAFDWVAGTNLDVEDDLIWYNMFWGNSLVVDNGAGMDIVVDTVRYNFKEQPLLKDTCLEGSATGTSSDINAYLYRNSPAIDRGNPRTNDPDGGRADIGMYGGLYADTLAPHQLDTLTVLCNTTTQRDTLIWEYASPPADFDQYAVYRDASGPGFVPGPGNIFDSITTSATTQIIYDNGGTEYFYKVSVWDDDTLGGGYKMFDTIPPYIGSDSIFYYCNGTVDPTDDTVVILLNEPVIDPFVFSVPADSYFVLTGLGNLTTCSLSTGAYPNDDTVVIYGFSDASHILCHERSWLGFRDASVWTDYVYNEGEQGDSVKVTTYNVANARTAAVYQTIGDAVSDAQGWDSLLVVDAGLYEENVDLDTILSLFGYGYRNGGWITGDSMPVVQAPGTGGNLLNVQDDSDVRGIKFIVPASVGAIGQMVEQSSYDPHAYSRCIFDGSYNTTNWDSYSGSPYHFLRYDVDSCDFTGFTGWVVYSRSRERTQSVKNSRIHHTGGGGFFYYPAGNHTVNQYFSNNMFYNVGGGNAIQMRQAGRMKITGNLFRDCRGGIGWTYSGNLNRRNFIAFNTVVSCTTIGIALQTDTVATDTVNFNIVWDNGSGDLLYSGVAPVADYNWFTGYNNGTWSPGACSDSGYPVFADTATDDYRLDPASLCLDFSDFTDAMAAAKGLTPYDLDGNPRSNPSGSYWDIGAYEGLLGPPRVDSVKSWCSGTASVGDDSIIVWFRRPIEDDSLDMGAGDAGNTFTVSGPGDVSNATVSSGSGVDDNQVVIRMENADSILHHNRSMLELLAGSVYDTFDVAPVAAVGDTDSVRTFNVYNLTTDAGYATIQAGYDADVTPAVLDTIMVFDGGLYTDTLHLSKKMVVAAYDTADRPVIGVNGPQMTVISPISGVSRATMVYIDAADTVILDGFDIDGSGTADTNFILMQEGNGRHVIRRCLIHNSINAGIVTEKGANRPVIIEYNDIYDIVNIGIDPHNDSGVVRHNRIHDIVNTRPSGATWAQAINAQDVKGCLFDGNIMYGISSSAGSNRGIALGNSRDLVIRNNILYDMVNGLYMETFGTVHCTSIVIQNNVCHVTGTALYLDDRNDHTVRNNVFWGAASNSVNANASALAPESLTHNCYRSVNAARVNMSGTGNFTDNPLFSNSTAGDFHLRVHSPCIDRGDTAAAYDDYDGSRCDIGAYGGPYGIDTLQTHVPDGPLTVTGNKEAGYTHDTLSWSPYAYSRGDFALYAVYRDTFTDFVPAAGNCLDSIADSSTVTAAYANNGKDYVYKLSAVNDTMYGSGYIAGTYARLYQLKTSNRYSTVPGDTVTYTLYYDNDGETASNSVFSIIDELPARAVYLDTLTTGLHSGGTVDVDWHNGAGWQETEPAPGTVRAVRWEIQPGIGAQSGTGDASGADLTKSGVDTTQGTDSGWVRFRVVIQ